MSQVEGEHAEKLNYESHQSLANLKKIKTSINHSGEQRLKQSNNMIETQRKTSVQFNQRWKLRSIIVHILIIIFGTSSWIGINGIFIQLPLLVNFLPESWGLAAYLVVIIQAANIAPLIYSLLHKSLKMNESLCILAMLGLGSLVMGLLAFLYDKTSSIAGNQHSTAMFILTFFIAAVSCTSSVLFMPYLRNFQEIYLVSYFIGEGLSGVLPSIVALVQGIGETSNCDGTNNTTQSYVVSPRFTSQSFFLFLMICLLSSLVAFVLLDNLSYTQEEKVSKIKTDNNSSEFKVKNNEYQKQVSLLPQSSTFENDKVEKDICIDRLKKTDIEEFSNAQYLQNENQKLLTNVNLFIILGVICLLANGLLPSIQPYSCLSYGNISYHLSATFSQIANPTACFLALWYLPHSKKIINWLTLVILCVCYYVFYLAWTSPNPPLKNLKIGKALVIFSWTLLQGLISYVKLMITSVFRRKSEKKLFHVGVVMQVGSACGAVLSFILINYTNLLHEHKSC